MFCFFCFVADWVRRRTLYIKLLEVQNGVVARVRGVIYSRLRALQEAKPTTGASYHPDGIDRLVDELDTRVVAVIDDLVDGRDIVVEPEK
jgi:hypothetical protein